MGLRKEDWGCGGGAVGQVGSSAEYVGFGCRAQCGHQWGEISGWWGTPTEHANNLSGVVEQHQREEDRQKTGGEGRG